MRASTVQVLACCRDRQIKKMISSYVGENKLFRRTVFGGDPGNRIQPSSTLAERIRAGGAGIPAFSPRRDMGPMMVKARKCTNSMAKNTLWSVV